MSDKKHTPIKQTKTESKFIVGVEMELMPFLVNCLPHKNRNNIKSLLRNKQVMVNGRVETQYNYLLQKEQVVEIGLVKLPDEKNFRGISIVYEDEHLMVIDKHAGVLSVAVPNKNLPTAYNMLSYHVKQQNASNKIFIVHRLDRETSGLLIYAKSMDIQQILQESWHESILERSYLALVEGKVEKSEGVITSYLNESKALIVYSSQNPDQGKEAITHYKVLKTNGNFTLLKVELETGRKNQIRVHMKDIEHPIVGDKKYGSTIDPIGRIGLHAWILNFIHPVSRKEMRFETSIPRKFTRII